MIDHLSQEQLSRLLIGDASPEEEQHAIRCGTCAEELTDLHESFSAFRGAVQNWTSASGGSAVPEIRRHPKLFLVRWALAIAVAALLLIAIRNPKFVGTRHHQATADDALLLEQVNTHLSRTLPAPLEPWMELISNAPTNSLGERR